MSVDSVMHYDSISQNVSQLNKEILLPHTHPIMAYLLNYIQA